MNDKPSPPWFGALILGCLTLATVWILTYTLAPLPGQNALGGWNYVIVGVLITFFIGLSMGWRGDSSEAVTSVPATGTPGAAGAGPGSSDAASP